MSAFDETIRLFIRCAVDRVHQQIDIAEYRHDGRAQFVIDAANELVFQVVKLVSALDLHAHVSQLKERGIGVLITDHNVRETLAITDRAYILHNGKILASGTASELANNPQAREIYLGEKFSL